MYVKTKQKMRTPIRLSFLSFQISYPILTDVKPPMLNAERKEHIKPARNPQNTPLTPRMHNSLTESQPDHRIHNTPSTIWSFDQSLQNAQPIYSITNSNLETENPPSVSRFSTSTTSTTSEELSEIVRATGGSSSQVRKTSLSETRSD